MPINKIIPRLAISKNYQQLKSEQMMDARLKYLGTASYELGLKCSDTESRSEINRLLSENSESDEFTKQYDANYRDKNIYMLYSYSKCIFNQIEARTEVLEQKYFPRVKNLLIKTGTIQKINAKKIQNPKTISKRTCGCICM